MPYVLAPGVQGDGDAGGGLMGGTGQEELKTLQQDRIPCRVERNLSLAFRVFVYEFIFFPFVFRQLALG